MGLSHIRVIMTNQTKYESVGSCYRDYRQKRRAALSATIFQLAGFLGTKEYILKQDVLAATKSIMKLKPDILSCYPKNIRSAFFRINENDITSVMTFLRRVARQNKCAILREKFNREVKGKVKTLYRYRLLCL